MGGTLLTKAHSAAHQEIWNITPLTNDLLLAFGRDKKIQYIGFVGVYLQCISVAFDAFLPQTGCLYYYCSDHHLVDLRIFIR